MIDKLPFLVPYFASGAISISIAVYASRKSASGVKAFAICAFAQASRILGYILELSSGTLESKILWDDFQWFGTLLYPLCFLIFALEYAEYDPKTIRRVRTWLAIPPVMFWVLMFTNSLHGLLRGNPRLIPGEPFSALTYQFTPVVYLSTIYIFATIIAALCILVVRFFRFQRLYRTQIALVVLGNLTLLAGGVLVLAGVTLGHQRDLSPVTYAISNVLVALGIFRYRLFDIVPVARETIFENMRDAVIILNERHQVIELNPAMLALIGQNQGQIIGGPAARVFEQLPEIIEHYATSNQVPGEITVKVNTELRHFTVQISPLYNHPNDLRGHLVVLHDITDRHRIEEALRASEERYRIISELISDYAFLFRVEPDGTLNLEWTTGESYTRLTGYGVGEVAPYRLYHPDDEARARQDVQQALLGETIEREYRILTKKGELRWVYMRRYPVWDNQQHRVTRFYGVARDITERKQMEQVLRENEARYRLLFESNPLPMWVADTQTLKFLAVNKAAVQHYGYSREEFLERTLKDIRLPEEIPDLADALSQHPAGLSQPTMVRHRKKDGTLIDVEVTASHLLFDGRSARLALVNDITERKQAEEALRTSEERHRIITNLISDYAFVYWPEPDGTFRLEWLAADPYTRLTGYNAAEIPISEIFRITYPEDLEHTRQAIQRTLQGQQTQSEYRLITKAGEVRWVYVHRYPIWDATHKRVTHFYGVGQDITERKHAEEALRASEERYRTVTNLISDYANVFRVEPDGTLHLEWITEDSFTRLTGYEAREIEDMFHLVSPEDEELVHQGVTRTLQGQPTEDEYRIVTKAGEVRWVNFRRNPVWDTEQGRVVRYYGVAQNITERKRAEAEEREQRTLAEALRDTAAALNSTLDLEGVLDCILQNLERVAPHDAEAVLLLESGIARVARAKSSLLPTWAEAIEGFQFPLATTRTLRQVCDTGQPLVIADVQQYSGWVDVGFDRWVRGFMCVPIQTEGSVIGFITLDSARPGFFTPKMVSGLRAFADQAAIAVCNAQLYQQAQELAAVQERQRLARDLHDAVSQSLFSASLIAETLPRLWQRQPDAVWPYLSDLQRLTRGALAEMRSLLLELRPKALEEADIGTLLGHLVNALSGRAQIKVGLEVFGHQVLRSELQVVIYRIAQEALNNVVKHARASEVGMILHNRPDLVELTITDNGRGFVESPRSSEHLGLKIMHERAQAVGATFLIRSEPGVGTEINLRWSPHQG